MRIVLAAAIGAAVAAASGRWRLGVALTGVLWQPALAVVGGAVWFLASRWRGLMRSRGRTASNSDDVVVFAELVSLGIGAGLSFSTATERAAAAIDGDVGTEAMQVLRRARIAGNAQALASGSEHLGALFGLASRSAVTGAPLAPTVAAYVADLRSEKAAERAAATKRLPVRLLLPLTLLILPGFVVLTLGPALLSGLQRVQL